MTRHNHHDLLAFLTVAKERSFTRAAAKIGVSQSTLSHTIRSLEERLGLRLLTRTTRSVAPTAAGERLLRTVGPRFEEIDDELDALTALREKPAGDVRITAGEHPAETILWPALERLLPDYPDIKLEISIDSGLTDIVAERYDAGVRLGERVAKGMIATRIGPDMRMAVVRSFRRARSYKRNNRFFRSSASRCPSSARSESRKTEKAGRPGRNIGTRRGGSDCPQPEQAAAGIAPRT
jgi:DNA-binding transcriptional LysR family regulator